MEHTVTDQTKDASELLRKARELAKDERVRLTGDDTGGRFEGRGYAGRYSIEGSTVEVTFTRKPANISWFTVDLVVKGLIR